MKKLIGPLCVALLFCGCGKSKSTSGTPAFFPYIDFDLPDSLVEGSTDLTLSESTTVIENTAQRIDRILQYLNAVNTRLNSDGVTGAGEFSGKGPNADVNGYVEELSQSAFNQQAVVCQGDNVFLHIKWSNDGQKVYAVRSYRFSPTGHPTSEFTVQLNYDLSASPTLEIHAQGKPFAKPAIVTSGLDYLVEHIQADRDIDGTTNIKTVADWYAAGTTQFKADTYLTGSIANNGAGSYVAYRKFNALLCPGSFTETDTTNPGWCLGRNLSSDTPYSDQERLTAWGQLSSIGIVAEATLSAVTVDPELLCKKP